MVYFYEGHMGGVYFSDRELSPEETYCDSCGDSDMYIGCAKTKEQAIELLFNNYESEDIYTYRMKMTKNNKTYYFSRNTIYANTFEDQLTDLPFLATEYQSKRELLDIFMDSMRKCNKLEESFVNVNGYCCEVEEHIEQVRLFSDEELTNVINSAFVPGYQKPQLKNIDDKFEFYGAQIPSKKILQDYGFVKRGHSWIYQKELHIEGIDPIIYYCILYKDKEHYHYFLDSVEYEELYEFPVEITNKVNKFIEEEVNRLRDLKILI